MKLDVTQEDADGGRVRLRLVGALDLSSNPAVYDAGVRALHKGAGIIVNLSAVTFMDSAGLGTLVELSREAEDVAKTFTVEEPSERVARVLAVTGLQDAWR